MNRNAKRKINFLCAWVRAQEKKPQFPIFRRIMRQAVCPSPDQHISSQLLTFLLGAVTMTASLIWCDTLKDGMDEIFPSMKKGAKSKLILALLVTCVNIGLLLLITSWFRKQRYNHMVNFIDSFPGYEDYEKQFRQHQAHHIPLASEYRDQA